MSDRICKIYLVRHGQSVANLHKVLGGDPELTDTGQAEARQTKQTLSSINFDEVYSSNRQRAIETAHIIFGKPIPKEHQIADLSERNYGALEGKPTYHQDAAHAEQMKLSGEDRWHYKPDDGFESDHEVVARFLAALKSIAKTNLGKTILVVAHGGCIRATLIELGYATWEELPPRSFKNSGHVKLLFDGNNLSVESVSGIDRSLAQG